MNQQLSTHHSRIEPSPSLHCSIQICTENLPWQLGIAMETHTNLANIYQVQLYF
jgi:hypothetical protein